MRLVAQITLARPNLNARLSAAAMNPTERIEIQSDGAVLEGVLHQPQGDSATAIVVVCHPHPQYGGTMENNVVMAVVEGALAAGHAAVRFNFRGVGRSSGAYDNGQGEREDVRAALTWARERPAMASVALAGYSFGAGIASSVVDASVTRLVLVAPPVGGLQREDLALRSYAGPVYLTSGDRDQIAKSDVLEQIAPVFGPRLRLEIVPGVDHSWWGHERELATRVCDFLGDTAFS
jgi:alpha/beta superfamily hydrolase